MAEESQALVRFEQGWAQDGVSEDGLPRFVDTVRIIKSVPPFTQVAYVATEQDFIDFPAPYEAFKKAQASRHLAPAEGGFPLALWPVVSPAQHKMLAARDIFTIEQLAKVRADQNTPGEFKALADRAKQMISLSQELGKFEAMLLDRDGQIEALKEQVKELRGTVQAQEGIINSLKSRVA